MPPDLADGQPVRRTFPPTVPTETRVQNTASDYKGRDLQAAITDQFVAEIEAKAGAGVFAVARRPPSLCSIRNLRWSRGRATRLTMSAFARAHLHSFHGCGVEAMQLGSYFGNPDTPLLLGISQIILQMYFGVYDIDGR